jgi:hypothetical protein
MTGPTDQFEGGCLCGAVRFTATGQPKGVYWCHCQSCRKHSGAPCPLMRQLRAFRYFWPILTQTVETPAQKS